MIKRLSILYLLFLLILSGCAPASYATSSAPMEAPAAAAPMAPGKSDGGTSNNTFAGDTASSPGGTDQRIVIRNANLTIVVDAPGDAMATIMHMAESMGGYVVASTLQKVTTQGGVEVPEANLTVRVPAEKLNDALDQIKALGKDPTNDILSENVSGQDVTKEYTDLNSRLKNLEASEAQLREIMASATKTEDVIAIFQQLTQVREQIEVTKGQIQYYKEASALSSIDVKIQAQSAVQPLQVGGWKPVGVAKDALQTLIYTLQFFANVAIWSVIYLLPTALVIFLPLWFLWWIIRRGLRNRKKRLAAITPPPPVVPPAAPGEKP
jgi:hypothetical protein